MIGRKKENINCNYIKHRTDMIVCGCDGNDHYDTLGWVVLQVRTESIKSSLSIYWLVTGDLFYLRFCGTISDMLLITAHSFLLIICREILKYSVIFSWGKQPLPQKYTNFCSGFNRFLATNPTAVMASERIPNCVLSSHWLSYQ